MQSTLTFYASFQLPQVIKHSFMLLVLYKLKKALMETFIFYALKGKPFISTPILLN